MLKKALTLLGLTITLSVSSLATAAVVTYQGMDYTIEWAHMGWAEIDQNSIYGPGGQPWYSNTNPHVADTWANLLGDTYLETDSLPEGPLFAGKFHTNNVIHGIFLGLGHTTNRGQVLHLPHRANLCVRHGSIALRHTSSSSCMAIRLSLDRTISDAPQNLLTAH